MMRRTLITPDIPSPMTGPRPFDFASSLPKHPSLPKQL